MDGHETEEENLQKRYRSRNFTKYEKDVFYSVFNQYVSIIGDKNSSAHTIREAWDKLVVEYNVQPNIYPRTRRQLQVLWRDEKFRAKKKEQKNKDRSPSKMTGGVDCEGESSTSTCEAVPSPSKPIATEGERHPSSLLTPLLTVIKREHEAYSAGEITPVLPLEPYPPPPAQETGPCSTLRSRSKQKKVHGKVIKQEESYSRSPSPERYGSGLDRVLPLPVEAQLHSGSSSPGVKHKYDNASSDEDDSYWSPNHHRRKTRKNGNKIEMGSSMDRHAIANKREREIHQHRLQQLRQEGAMRMRVLEAELSLRQQQQHMEQQEHNLKMEILREKLKRLREGKPFAD
ncbi:myb/SANT-like DNA-binding domain-containing protein 3 [Macrobrachium rosenbergii]|uniref:myb/SANT-like DNA-binding domain-containing protein 3 n=1 Tax=Macrobrachium rosenbergii TaxID=79674 RepID=UPI0034D6A77D